MIKKLLQLFCILTTFGIYADESASIHLPQPISLVNFTSEPSTVINGCVNAISGDFVDSALACQLSGPDGYQLGHCYVSSFFEKGNLAQGWTYLHNHKLKIHQSDGRNYSKEYAFEIDPLETLLPKNKHSEVQEEDGPILRPAKRSNDKAIKRRIQKEKERERKRQERKHNLEHNAPFEGENKETVAVLYEPAGGKMIFKGDGWAENFELKCKNTGLTNTGSGNISGQTNLKNIKLKRVDTDTFRITTGNGTIRTYTRKKQKHRPKPGEYHYFVATYQIKKEELPSGNVVIYTYNSSHDVKKIQVKNHSEKTVLSGIKFKYLDPKGSDIRKVLVKTSDKKQITFTAKKIKDKHNNVKAFAITSIERPGIPTQKFEYSEPNINHELRVAKKELSNGFYLQNRYYRKGKNTLGDKTTTLTKKKRVKFLRNKVRTQWSPVGVGQNPERTYSFEYHQKNDDELFHTTVEDAYKNKTRFFYNKYKRLTLLEKYNGQDNLLSKEQFIWGTNGRDEKGNLLCHTLYDEKKDPIFSKEYEYDTHGNVIREKYWGFFTQKAGELIVDKEGYPSHKSTCDHFSIHRKYSHDNFNLKLEETDPSGLKTIYEYKKDTNLLEAKFIINKGSICHREFFKYDDNAVLIKHILDDGSSKDSHDLKDVRLRSIKRIEPRMKAPHLGDPEVLEEYFYDFSLKQEVLVLRTENTYNNKGLVIEKRIYDSEKQLQSQIAFQYNDNDHIIYTKDTIGRETIFSWDEFGHLIMKKGPRFDLRTEYAYDIRGLLIKEVEVHDNGLVLATHYEYDMLSRKTAVISPQGNITRFMYDAIGRVTEVQFPEVLQDGLDPVIPTKKIEYKSFGRTIIETDELGFKKTTKLSAFGKPLLEIFPDGTVKTYDYDYSGRLIKEVAPNKSVTEYTYDALGRLVHTQLKADNDILFSKSLEYDRSLLVKEKTITDETLELKYDFCGRVIKQKKSHPSSSKIKRTKSFYDLLGRLIEERTYSSNKNYIAKHLKYDQVNRVIQEEIKDRSGTLHSIVNSLYDNEDNVIETTSIVQGQLSKTSMSYLPHGLLEKAVDALGNITHCSYDFYFINTNGRKVLKKTTTDAQGSFTTEEIDHRGLTEVITKSDPFNTIIAKKEQRYDAQGNCIRTIDYPIYQGSEEKRIYTCYQYGPCQRLTGIFEAKGETEQKVTYFEYNQNSELDKIIRSDRTIVFHEYDKKGRVRHYWTSDDTINYYYEYDRNDNITSVKNAITNEITTRSYDEFGVLHSETLETGFKTDYTSDLLDRVEKITLFDASSIEYSYSPVQLNKIKRITKNSEWSHKIIDRDLSGNINQEAFLKDVGTLSYTYDVLGRFKKMKHDHFEQEVPQDGYDAVGNLLSIITKDPNTQELSLYSYDYLHQLTQEKGHANHDYAYDSLYNRRKLDDKDYQVNSLHSLLTDSKNNYTYDPFGNRTIKQSDTETTHYTYDALDRMTCFEVENTLKVLHSYDAFHRRTKKITFTYSDGTWQQEKEERFLYIDDREIGMVNEENTICQLRVLGEGLGAEIGASVAFELNDELFVPLHDYRGNITALLDGNNGNIVESYRYSSFGVETIYDSTNNVIPKSLVNNPWRFSSKRTDSESGCVYFGRRYYDPTVGRWLTQDPLGVKAGPNLYAYVLNCPITSFDLYGLIDESRSHVFHRDFNSSGQSYADAQHERFINAYNPFVSSSSGYSSDVPYRSHSSDHNHRQSERVCEPGAAPKANKSSKLYNKIIGGANGVLNHGTSSYEFYEYITLKGIDYAWNTLYNGYEYDEDDPSFIITVLDFVQNHRRENITAGIQKLSGADPNSEEYQTWQGYSNNACIVVTACQKLGQKAVMAALKKDVVGNAGKFGIKEAVKNGGRSRFAPDPNAVGAHTVFRRNGTTGKVTHYETYVPQTNRFDPKPWESVKRFDNSGVGDSHYNKVFDKEIFEPHVHAPSCPGGIRPAEPWEIPK